MESIILKVKNPLDKGINIIVITLLAVLVGVVILSVFNRYVMGNPIQWSAELSRYIFIWMVFLSASIAYRENKHLQVDMLVDLFPHVLRRIIYIFGQLLILTFLCFVLYITPEIMEITFRQTSPTLSISMGWVYLAFPASLALMLVEQVFRVLLYWARESGRRGYAA
ncbi:TRAP transporter small permease [Shouchella shacheensis]|uniref:TRAP transporter small permease n=1 Tax=Shouchella shacheensis TaxID=1649580 RepID=UPI00073FB09F|nr:TRAP transporter small permease [Shouchella shacheensis]